MIPPLLPSPTLSKADASELRFLTVLFTGIGGLMLVGTFIPLLAIIQGVRILVEDIVITDGHGAVQDARVMGWAFVVGGPLLILAALAIGMPLVRLGVCLARRRNHARALSLSRSLRPVGLLAVNALMRPSVKAAFDHSSSADPRGAP